MTPQTKPGYPNPDAQVLNPASGKPGYPNPNAQVVDPNNPQPAAGPQDGSLWDNFRSNPRVMALQDRWRSWIVQPGNRQALLQFSINALQPVPIGQSTLGHLAGAVGAGAEARDRYVTGQMGAEEMAAQSAREQTALGLDEQQLAINQQNADTAQVNAARGSGSTDEDVNAFVADRLQDIISNGQMAEVGSTERLMYDAWLTNDPAQRAEVIQALREEYGILVGGGAPPVNAVNSPNAPQAAAGGGGDTLAALAAAFPDVPPGTVKYEGSVGYQKQEDGSWVRI